MKKIKYYYKNKNLLVESFEKEFDCELIKEPSFLNKLLFTKKQTPNIYFHSGKVEESSLELAKNSDKVVVNSQTLKYKFVDSGVKEESLEVIYPLFKIQEFKESAKESLLDELGVEDKSLKVVLFTAKNLKSSGAKEFIEVLSSLNSKNYIAIIAGESKQIYNLKFQLNKYPIKDTLFLIEDFANPDLLFMAADIFILPTYVEGFSINVLKAMYYKCAVFVSADNSAREIIDVFATMESPTDSNTSFKVDALLSREEDLTLIQKQNHETSLNFSYEKEYEKFTTFVKETHFKN